MNARHDAAVEVRGLGVRYGPRDVLFDLTFDLSPGASLALLGPSGSGKSTTLMAMAGLLRPAAGSIWLGGRDVTSLPPERRNAVYLFQEPLLFPFLNVAGNVAFGLEARGVPAAEVRRRVQRMLERVRLSDLGTRRPEQLSGGQQQRVALARALVTEPLVLLLDEPFASLDVGLRDEMQQLVAELRADLGVTMLLVTHDPVEAARVGDRVGLLVDGRLTALGPPADVLGRTNEEIQRAARRLLGGGPAGSGVETLQ